MNQIVYQPQNELDQRGNIFKLSTDQIKHLNLILPVGYSIITRNKAMNLPSKKKDNISVAPPQQKTNKVHFEDQKYDNIITFEPLPPPPPPKKLSPQMTRCMRILENLKTQPNAAIFLDPVDTSVILDYLDYVNQPIDLGIIQYNVQNGIYETFTQFIVDIKKMWNNAFSYNPKDTPIYIATVQLQKYFYKLLKDENVPIPTLEVLAQPPIRQTNNQPRPEPKRKPTPNVFISDVPLTLQQKRNIISLIRKLPNQYLKGVWAIVSPHNNDQEDYLQFDIETLPTKKARELQMYVKKSFADMDAQNKQNPSYQSRTLQNQISQNQSSFIIDEDDSN